MECPVECGFMNISIWKPKEFQNPYDAACRMMVFMTLHQLVYYHDYRDVIVDWLKVEKLWEHASPKEQAFLNNTEPTEQDLSEMSWMIEGAITLGWVLNIVETLPRLDAEDNTVALRAFDDQIPDIGDETQNFIKKLEFRNRIEIVEEQALNEMCTSYFRDLLLGGEDETHINRFVSFERHKTLNWLLKITEGDGGWDDVDTST